MTERVRVFGRCPECGGATGIEVYDALLGESWQFALEHTRCREVMAEVYR